MEKFSFVMLVYNEGEFITKTLDSIKNYAYEIVVGNNECTDETMNVLMKQ